MVNRIKNILKKGLTIATITTFIPFSSAFAVNDNSLDLEDTSNQYASINNDLGWTGGATSQEAWIRLESNPASGSFYGITFDSDGGNRVIFRIYYTENAGNYDLSCKRERMWTNGTAITWASANLSTGTWYHVACNYDATNMNLYTATAGATHTLRAGPTAASGNGITNGADCTAVGTTDPDNGGTCAYSTVRDFDGLIDDVRFWSDARTAGEFDDNDELELVGNEANLIAYYELDNDYTDQTASAFNLTSSGSPVFSTTVPFTDSTTSYPQMNWQFLYRHEEILTI